MTSAWLEVLITEDRNQALALPRLLEASPGRWNEAAGPKRPGGIEAGQLKDGLCSLAASTLLPFLQRQDSALGAAIHGSKLVLNANQEGNYNNVKPTCLLLLEPW